MSVHSNLRRSIVALGVVAGLASIGACSSGSGSSPDQKTVGVVLFDSTDDFNKATGAGIKALAEQNGWKVSQVEAAGSVDKTNTAIQNFVSQGVDGIITTVVSSSSLASGLAQAKAAGIPVVTQDGGLADGISAAVSTVDDASNLAVIDKMFEDLGGTGKVLAFTYAPGLPCKLRDDNLLEEAKKYPDVEVETYELPANGVSQAGATAASAWLAKNQSYTGSMAVWGCYDDPAIGAMASVKQDGRDVKLYGYNGSEGALQGIKDGTFQATELFDPAALGQQTFGALLDVLKDPTAEPRTIDSDFTLVTAENVDEFLKS